MPTAGVDNGRGCPGRPTLGGMSGRDLDAAGIVDPQLRSAYERCREAQRRSTARRTTSRRSCCRAAKRPYVHALYGFARYADEIVDGPRPRRRDADDRLKRWADGFRADVTARRTATTRQPRGRRHDPPVGHPVDTVRGVPDVDGDGPQRHGVRDLRRPDAPTSTGRRPSSASRWSRSSVRSTPAAYGYARDLGIAFQLANFVRDVGEDLDRGRVYLPLEDLDRLRSHAGGPRAAPGRRPGEGPAAVRDRAGTSPRAGSPSRHRTARPHEPTVHRGGADPLLRHRRRGRAHRLPGLRPARPGPLTPTPHGRRSAPGSTPRERAERADSRPQNTHHANVCSTSENPNSRSSTGAHATWKSPKPRPATSHRGSPTTSSARSASRREHPVGHQLAREHDRVGNPESPTPHQTRPQQHAGPAAAANATPSNDSQV